MNGPDDPDGRDGGAGDGGRPDGPRPDGAPLVLGAGPADAAGESLITYPAEIAVKAIGRNGDVDGVGLPELVGALVAPLIDPAPSRIEAIPSSGGRYVSVRVHFTATSRAQLEAVYGALHVEPRVLQTL